MNKNELVSAIAEECGVAKKDIEKVVKSLTAVIHKELGNGGKVQIPDLGAFKANERKERTVRNPRTGESMVSPACKVAKFTPAKALKDSVNK
ncbi:MAG: HU family DNA-binding protein [Eubacteriales bacterium]|nr:HU family DNA-binding protein [Eubacteriales bacterium]